MNATKWSSMLFAVALFCCSLIPMKSHACGGGLTNGEMTLIIGIPASIEAMDLGFVAYDIGMAVKDERVSRAYANTEIALAGTQLGLIAILEISLAESATRDNGGGLAMLFVAGFGVLPTAMLVHGIAVFSNQHKEYLSSNTLVPNGNESPQNVAKVEAFSKPQLLGIGPTAVLGSDQKLVPAFALSASF